MFLIKWNLSDTNHWQKIMQWIPLSSLFYYRLIWVFIFKNSENNSSNLSWVQSLWKKQLKQAIRYLCFVLPYKCTSCLMRGRTKVQFPSSTLTKAWSLWWFARRQTWLEWISIHVSNSRALCKIHLE